MITDPKTRVQNLWDSCDVLRDDSLDQLTYLLFLRVWIWDS